MLFFIAEDDYYYSKSGEDEILEKYKNIQRVVKMPNMDDLRDIGTYDVETTAFMAPVPPENIFGDLGKTLFFDVVRLQNKYGVITSGQHRIGLSKEEVLKKLADTEFIKPTETMEDYIGGEGIYHLVHTTEQKLMHRQSVKGFLLTGVPGTGKSHFAKCFAGHLGFTLVPMNLSIFMEKGDAVQAINNFFKFFQETPGEYVIWIDEIEKMFVGEKSQQVMGAMLTNINDANNISGDSKFLIIATANNVSSIDKKNPEFFRSGRFDAIIFLMNPTVENARRIFEFYIKREKRNTIKTLLPMGIALNAKGMYNKDIKIKKMSDTFFDKYGKLIKKNDLMHLKDSEIMQLFSRKEFFDPLETIMDEFSADFNIEYFMRKSSQEYRKDSSMKDRFIYTPAEIQHIVGEFYKEFYLSDQDEVDYMKLLRKYKPLQVTTKEGIRDIIAKASNFVEI